MVTNAKKFYRVIAPVDVVYDPISSSYVECKNPHVGLVFSQVCRIFRALQLTDCPVNLFLGLGVKAPVLFFELGLGVKLPHGCHGLAVQPVDQVVATAKMDGILVSRIVFVNVADLLCRKRGGVNPVCL